MNWRHAKHYGGNAWAEITGLTVQFGEALQRKDVFILFPSTNIPAKSCLELQSTTFAGPNDHTNTGRRVIKTRISDAALSRGDELVSLTTAFINAGKPSVIASLWQVDEAATTQLVSKCYRNLKTMTKVEALVKRSWI